MSYLEEVSYSLYLMRECFVHSRKFFLVHILLFNLYFQVTIILQGATPY